MRTAWSCSRWRCGGVGGRESGRDRSWRARARELAGELARRGESRTSSSRRGGWTGGGQRGGSEGAARGREVAADGAGLPTPRRALLRRRRRGRVVLRRRRGGARRGGFIGVVQRREVSGAAGEGFACWGAAVAVELPARGVVVFAVRAAVARSACCVISKPAICSPRIALHRFTRWFSSFRRSAAWGCAPRLPVVVAFACPSVDAGFGPRVFAPVSRGRTRVRGGLGRCGRRRAAGAGGRCFRRSRCGRSFGVLCNF